MNDETVVSDNSNTEEIVDSTTTENTEQTVEETQEETVEQVKARLAKAEELAKNYKIRAEKAENKAKESTSTETKAHDGLSIKDWKALQDVHDDDVEEIVEWAKFKKISVADAKKSDHIKTFLKDKEEQRKTAKAVNTGPARRSAVKVSDEEIVEKVSKGELPEDPEALAKARWNLKKANKA